MTAALDQNDKLKAGELPDDPASGAMPVVPNTSARRDIAKSAPRGISKDEQAEASLLATLLWCGAYAPETVSITSIQDLVYEPSAFVIGAHVAIFAAIQSLSESNKPIDVTSVHSELLIRQKNIAAGGVAYLEKLVSLAESCSVLKAREYAQRVRDAWLRRKTRAIAEEVIAACGDGQIAVPDVAASAIERLRQVAETTGSDATTISMGTSIRNVFRDLDRPKDEATADLFATGIRDLDRLILGLKPRETMLIAARTSVGKTLLATQISTHIVENNERVGVLYITLEMPAETFTRRLLASRAHVDPLDLMRRNLDDDEWARVNTEAVKLAPLRVYFQASSSQTIMSIDKLAKDRASSLAQEGVRLVGIVIDHIGLVKPSPRTEKRNRNEQIAEASNGTRYLANTHHCWVLALVQISRAFDGAEGFTPPRMNQMKDSGTLEDDADFVTIIHRRRDANEMFVPDEPAFIKLAKNRPRGGELGMFETRLHGGKFHDWNGSPWARPAGNGGGGGGKKKSNGTGRPPYPSEQSGDE